MIFSKVTGITIPEGSVSVVAVEGRVLWKRSKLPTGYTELEYVETTGEQYMDLGFIPNQDTRVVCEFMLTDTENFPSIYGARRSVTADNFSFRVSMNRWQPTYNTEYGTFTTVPVDKNWHIADQNKNKFYFDGILRDTRTYAAFRAPNALTVGAIHGNAGIVYCKGCFRSCQVWDNGTLVREMVPCMAPDGKPGMYDKVHGKFYGNAGAGEMLAGTKVQ